MFELLKENGTTVCDGLEFVFETYISACDFHALMNFHFALF